MASKELGCEMNEMGLSLWRSIGEALKKEIELGELAPGERLPADIDLAVRFGVNRHTVRRALDHLKDQGLLRSVQGQGTFVMDDVTEYRLGSRTRFTQNLLTSQRTPGRRLISVATIPADETVRHFLSLRNGEQVALVCVVGEADGKPISFGRNYFPCRTFPEIADAFRAHLATPDKRLSMTSVFTSIGVSDYHRRMTKIACRPPTSEEAKHLRSPRGEYVLETEALDVADDERPFTYATTAFRSSAVRFVLES